MRTLLIHQCTLVSSTTVQAESQASAVVQEQQGRLRTVQYFSNVCASWLSNMSTDKAGLDRMHHQFEVESAQFHQGLPIYAHKADFLGLSKKKQCIVLRAAAGFGEYFLATAATVFGDGGSCLYALMLCACTRSCCNCLPCEQKFEEGPHAQRRRPLQFFLWCLRP